MQEQKQQGMHAIGGACPHRQGIRIPQDGSIVARVFDKKTSGMPMGEKVEGEVLSVTMEFIGGIRQERISDAVFVRPVDDVASSYRLTDPGRLES
jgi:hypothetical protein